ncbi:MAG TPA: STAS domain-containing protein [Thermodesulfovibrionales bacterium]|nr:STAS domain-containing protein [Thermodesulfovibrionales bacterium]
MKVEIIDNDGRKIIGISGDIDMYSSPALRDELMGLIRKKAQALCIDLRSVTYIDSSGIATFVEGLKCMKAYGGRLQFCEVPEGILEIFRFSKLDRVFELYGTIDDAINS